MATLAMFPLGTVLFPGMLLPLHVFEPRYRTLVRRVREGDGHFGVVLITRGHEVGGDDERAMVGTRARLVEWEDLGEGRGLALAVGAERIRVREWLPDAPHPVAAVEAWPDHDDTGPTTDDLRRAVARRLRRVLALNAELGEPTPTRDTDLRGDLVASSYRAATFAPVTSFDAQRLLVSPGPHARLELAGRLLEDVEDVLRFRLGNGEE